MIPKKPVVTLEDRADAICKQAADHGIVLTEESRKWLFWQIHDAQSYAMIDRHNSVVECMQDQIDDAVKTEREACAKVAEDNEPLGGQGEVAEAIRARGETT